MVKFLLYLYIWFAKRTKINKKDAGFGPLKKSFLKSALINYWWLFAFYVFRGTLNSAKMTLSLTKPFTVTIQIVYLQWRISLTDSLQFSFQNSAWSKSSIGWPRSHNHFLGKRLSTKGGSKYSNLSRHIIPWRLWYLIM